MPAFLDDFAGFSTTSAGAWYPFATFLDTALEINLRVSFKPGKTESPASIMGFIGSGGDDLRLLPFQDRRPLRHCLELWAIAFGRRAALRIVVIVHLPLVVLSSPLPSSRCASLSFFFFGSRTTPRLRDERNDEIR
eukprot:COSAG04_NODE_4817_length_1880_cov_8.916625_2_plen_136_part_00